MQIRHFGLLLCSSLSWLRMEKSSSLKKASLKNHRILDHIKISPFVVPTTIRKEAPTESAPIGATLLKAVTNHFSQLGENWTTEALNFVFNPSQGEEGVETPPPNDSLKASLSPPVGGCLRSFRRDCQTNKCSNDVLNIITNGYILPFISRPKLARFTQDTRPFKKTELWPLVSSLFCHWMQ